MSSTTASISARTFYAPFDSPRRGRVSRHLIYGLPAACPSTPVPMAPRPNSPLTVGALGSVPPEYLATPGGGAKEVGHHQIITRLEGHLEIGERERGVCLVGQKN